MSCYNCAKTFSVFSKEKSCKNCGFAFCSKCLTQKMIPKLSVKGNVCRSCEKSFNAPQISRAPPDALQRRLDFLENPPARNPITVYTQSTQNKRITNLKRGMSVEDKAIADRLERLQKDRKASMDIPTEAEMEERLMRLKDRGAGIPCQEKKEENYKHLHKTDNRSDVQKCKDLIEQANAEVKLETKLPKPEDDIRDRLARLRGHEIVATGEPMDICPESFLEKSPANITANSSKSENMLDLSKLLDEVAMDAENDANVALKEFECDKDLQKRYADIMKQKSNNSEIDQCDTEEDEEEATKVVRGILSEVKLDEGSTDEEDIKLPNVPTVTPTHFENESSAENEEKELPWCSICNADAIVRCVEGCDGDLYCSRCFKECHDEIDLKEHKTIVFKPNQR